MATRWRRRPGSLPMQSILTRRLVGRPPLLEALVAHDDLSDRNVKFPYKMRHHAVGEPALVLPKVHHNDDLVGPESAHFVFDSHEGIGIADLTPRREALLGGPGQRGSEPLLGFGALAIDVRGPIVD